MLCTRSFVPLTSYRTTARQLRLALSAMAVLLTSGFEATPARAQDWDVAREVLITRTEYGVPHIEGPTLRHAFFGLAYAQAEDHGQRVLEGFVRARGELALLDGTEANVLSDVTRRQTYARAVASYDDLDPDVREIMEGFAAGLNHYLALHPDEQPPGVRLDFTGVDAHALTIGWWDTGKARRFAAEQEARADATDRSGEAHAGSPDSASPELALPELASPALALPDFASPDFAPAWQSHQPWDGSNAWALAPERTPTQRAILLRNPHLSWSAGYYEAHVTVPGDIDFYGDFRVGGLFGIIAGFNASLGWATTNNGPDLSAIYRIERDPDVPSRFVLDGVSYPIRTTRLAIQARHEARFASTGGEGVEVHHVRTTHVGPVVYEDSTAVYVMRSADDGEVRRGEQFLAMMRASSFEEFRAAMRMQRISASNYTYADRDGNIFYVWNAKLPKLPHAHAPDTAITVTRVSEMWSEFHPFDSLPQLLNPDGGYLRNENDPPYFTNLNAVLDPSWYPENMPEPRLRLRSQNSLEILDGQQTFSLEEVVTAKHTMTMLLADRVKDDLLAAIRVTEASAEARAAARLLDGWDNTASREAQGAVLFAAWWNEYTSRVDTSEVYREPWSFFQPTTTPDGLGRPDVAAEAFEVAVASTAERYGSFDVAWGEVYRVRHGAVDVPVGGCPGALGCFRVLGFRDGDDGRREVQRGDGWVLAVEFGDVPRAFSVLAYGQSSREGAAHMDDQAALFADNRMKPVRFTAADVEAAQVERYRPGEARRSR